jgi:hypothetical protein
MKKKLLAAFWIGVIFLTAVAFFAQFRVGHLGPLAIATLLCGLVWRFRPSLRVATLFLASLFLTAFTIDCLLLRHRMAVELRAWSIIWDTESIDDIIPSPSGRTTVYIVGSHWLDSAYWAYISDGGLFPRHRILHTIGPDAYYPKDLKASWTGTVFTAAEGFVTLRYDESTRQIESFTR